MRYYETECAYLLTSLFYFLVLCRNYFMVTVIQHAKYMWDVKN